MVTHGALHVGSCGASRMALLAIRLRLSQSQNLFVIADEVIE
jgi:hypothetical protein